MPGKIPTLAPPHVAEFFRAERLKANRFYASKEWRRTRALKIGITPWCEACDARGLNTPAQQVHHKKDRRTHPALAYDLENLESVCVPCHNAKRAGEGRASGL